MKSMEYRTADKSEWGHGVWHQEPDKMQWQDEATGLPCLIVRNNSGAWCGYVGVSEGHPLHGIDYSGTAKLPKGMLAKMLEARGVGDLYSDDLEKGEVRVEAILSAHGGITFADSCGDHSRETWEQWRKRKVEREAEAKRYPVGDSARFLREWAECFDDYHAWLKRIEAVGICHVAESSEPQKVWWFGFDCSHSGDVSPAYDSLRAWSHESSYKDVDYVRQEVTQLAKQLKEVADVR